jgi:uncharacterized membrane protein YgdD (TMEM256/DUF423 family)
MSAPKTDTRLSEVGVRICLMMMHNAVAECCRSRSLHAGRRPAIVGGLATAGIVLFSGSCYAVALAEDKGYGRLAPYG